MATSERLLLIATPLMNRTPAFDRAAALAKARNAKLHIVAFDYIDGIAEAGLANDSAINEIRLDYLHSHRDWLEKQALGIRHMGVTVTTEVMWVRHPFDEIPAYIQDFQPSMAIKDLRHESWISRALFTSLDRRLLHTCRTPLHLVAKVQRGLPRRIVAAVDPFHADDEFEHLNQQILTTAKALAGQCGAQLYVLYVYDLSYLFAEDGWGYEPSAAEKLYAEAKTAFAELADQAGIAIDRRHMVVGTPARMIESYMSSQDMDVVVLGTVHRDLAHVLLGSTTEHVVNHLYSSLLTVNPRSAGR